VALYQKISTIILMSKPRPNVRVGIVEDDRLTRMLLVELIHRQDRLVLVGHWGSAGELMKEIGAVTFDLLLVDIDLPDLNGIELMSRVKSEQPDVVCVMLTSSSDPTDVLESLRRGASGYLVKATSPRDLVESIRAAAEEGVVLSPKIAGFLVNEFVQMPKAGGTGAPGLEGLTSREHEILQLIAADLSAKDCAVKLDIGYETVRTHLKRIYQKLHVNSSKQAAERFRLREGKSFKE